MSQPGPSELYELRQQVISLEEKNERLSSSLVAARDRLQDMGEQLTALSRPPASFGTFIVARHEDHSVDALVGGRKMNLAASSRADLRDLRPGQELRLNEQLVVVGAAGYEDTGSIVQIELVIDEQRVLVRIHQVRIPDRSHRGETGSR